MNNIFAVTCLFFFIAPLTAYSATVNTENSIANEAANKSVEIMAASLQEKITTIEKQIENIVGSANCINSTQCDALAMGNKACGRPITFIPFSSKDTNTTKLFALSEQHQQQSKALNKLTGAISDCMLIIKPTFVCREQICQK